MRRRDEKSLARQKLVIARKLFACGTQRAGNLGREWNAHSEDHVLNFLSDRIDEGPPVKELIAEEYRHSVRIDVSTDLGIIAKVATSIVLDDLPMDCLDNIVIDPALKIVCDVLRMPSVRSARPYPLLRITVP